MTLRALPVLAAALSAACAFVVPPADDGAEGRTQSWAIDATLTAKPSQASYRTGETVSARVAVINDGEVPLSCLMPCGELAAVGALTDAAGKTHEVRALPAAERPGEPAYWRPLAHQERAEHDIPVSDRFLVTEPGRYSFRVVARGRQGWIDRLHPRMGDLETSLKFEVVASTGL